MLGRTAGGLFWMFRYLERAENTARLVETGFRIALTRPGDTQAEWASVIDTAAARGTFLARHDRFDQASVIDFLLREPANPSSVRSAMKAARDNARDVRTALSREVWEAVNEGSLKVQAALARPVRDRDLPGILGLIRQQSAQVRGALHGSMLRNDMFNFTRLGTFIERADSTARILDVKYYVLLPSIAQIGSALDNVQWETILRSVGGYRAFRWHKGAEITPRGIAEFLMLDACMPRSLAFCTGKIAGNLTYVAQDYGTAPDSLTLAGGLHARLAGHGIDAVFDAGLHEFILGFLADLSALARAIETDYRFYA
jgi:uncharacterized alpha-E superfamily protein